MIASVLIVVILVVVVAAARVRILFLALKRAHCEFIVLFTCKLATLRTATNEHSPQVCFAARRSPPFPSATNGSKV